MRKLNSFWFGFFLAFSIIFCWWCFKTAASWRVANFTSNGVGGEMFSLLVPAGVIYWRKESL